MTSDQIALLEKFRFNLPDDLAIQAAAIAQTTGLRDSYLAVDAAYAAAQSYMMGVQAAALTAKKAALDAADSDGTHVYAVNYGGAHPSHGGTNPADWDVEYSYSDNIVPDPPPFPDLGPPYLHVVVVYSHAVAWDSNALILSTESGWTGYQTGRFDHVWGVSSRAGRMTNALATMATRGAIITGREDAALALMAAGQPLRKRKLWTTSEFLATRQATVTVKSQNGVAFYSPVTDYRIVEGIDGLEDMRTFQRVEGSTMEAVVAVEAP